MTAPMRDRGKWATVACPKCGAAHGLPCIGAEREPLRRPHWERFTAAREDPSVRDRGDWASPPAAARHRPGRSFNLPRPLHAVLEALVESGANQSALAETQLCAHPSIAPHYEATAAAHAAHLAAHPGDVIGAHAAAKAAFVASKKNDTPREATS